MNYFRLRIETKNLMFPASVPGQPVYRTAVLSNDGDTPILFDIPQDQEKYVSSYILSTYMYVKTPVC